MTRIGLAIVLVFCAAVANAQGNLGSKTIVSVELLITTNGPALAAQDWGRAFAKLGVSPRIRRPLLDDKPEVKETTRGTLRYVKVVGELDRSGRVKFPGNRVYTLSNTRKLGEWLDELKTFGAQGAPDGKPAFGLSELQFSKIYAALSHPVTADFDERVTIDEALASLDLPAQYPLQLNDSAVRLLERPRLVRQSVKGMSHGAALAVLLNDAAMSFRPLRTPRGNIELAVDAAVLGKDRWPIGWPQTESNLKTAPKLFKMVPVELDNVALSDVLFGISAKAEIPVVVDYYNIARAGIKFDELKVSYPSRRVSWSQLLRGVTNPNKMARRLVIDEGGNPFIWITTLTIALKRDQAERD